METDVQGLMENLIGHYGWIVVTFAIGFFFKESIMSWIQGMMVFMDNNFNNDDVVYISGREARVVRVGFTKTVFYMTDRGSKMVVPNEKLKDLTLEKRLPPGSRRAKDGYLPKSTDKLSDKQKQGLHAVAAEKSVVDKGKKI
jgi:small-conductance mechanosensitive channel|tara:strand:- start:311 stop:736 length:426 start_codon:yes stop_codon:yes gene_type:complete